MIMKLKKRPEPKGAVEPVKKNYIYAYIWNSKEREIERRVT
jgi:hypothetical protein